ncbi:MAG: tetratricopeptide repeat protein, partial [Emticicia sp.]|uniref:tetratricopeptide repeat protein n=1 Tax=Emticicia sp. TaxID=1930953 RepID=UPI003BA6C191
MKIAVLIILLPFLVVAQDIRELIRKADKKYENGKYIAATELYSSVNQYYSSVKQYENYLHYSWKKAWAYTEIQERTKAIEELRHSMAFVIGKKSKIQDTALFKHYSLLYHNYVLFSRPDSAEYFAELNDKLLLKNPRIGNIANAYYYFRIRGYIEDVKGNFALSEPYFKKASKIIEKLPVSEKYQAYNGMGMHYQIQNNNEVAKKYFLLGYNQALNDIDKAYFILNVAATTSEAKVFEMREYLQKAKNHYKKHKIIDNKLAYDLALREGIVCILEGNYDNAEKNYKHCIEICEKAYLGRTPWMQNTAYVRLSQNAVLQNELKKAIDYAQKAIQAIHFDFKEDNVFKNPSFNRGIVDRLLHDALTQKAKVAVLIFKQTKDKRYLTLASEIFSLQSALATKIRVGYEGESSKLFLASQVKSTFDLGIEALWDIDSQKCFELQERTKSSILLDALLNAENRVKFLPDSIRKKEDNLDKERTALIRSISNVTNAKQKDSIVSLIADKDIALEAFQKKLNIDFPLYAKEKYNQDIPTIKQIQNSIDQSTSIISYHLTPQKLYFFVIDKSAYQVKKVMLDSNFLHKIGNFRNLLANSPQGKKYNAQALSAE